MTNLTEKTAAEVKYRLMRALCAKEPVEALSNIFTKLQDPDLDEMVLYHYIKSMQAQLVNLEHERTPGRARFHSYQKFAIKAGFVKMIMTIAQDPRTDQWHGLSSYFAMNSMWGLMRAGTMEERRELMHEMLNNNALEICTNKIDHPLAIHRNVGLETLRCLAAESILGETMSSMQMSELIVKLCQHIISGHEFYAKQFYAEETAWQSFVCFGSFGHSKEKARKYAPRYFAMTQEKAAFAIQGLLMTSPSLGQNFYATIIEHNPKIVGLMLKCAALPRYPWYPESQVDQLLSESLVLLMRVPCGHIPGLNIPIEDDISLWISGEWDLVRRTVLLAFGGKGAFSQLIEIWNAVEDEKTENIEKMVENVTDYFAQAIPGAEDLMSIFDYRGAIRVAVERIIATITSSISGETDLPTKDLLSFLNITHQALRPKIPEDEIMTAKDEYYAIETEFECFRRPQYTVICPDDTIAVEMQIADEATIGPTAHARVLTLLAQRGILDDIARDRRSLPRGAWSTRLTRPALRQMTSPAALRKFAALGRQRVTERKDEGARRFKEENEAEFACAAYSTSAELAIALINFDDATNGAYSSELGGIRKDLVLCLGNAAQMMISMGRLHRGQCYANAAVEYVKTLPEGNSLDAVSAEIREKNRRRLQTCRKDSDSFFEHFMRNRA